MEIIRRPSRRNTSNWANVAPEAPPEAAWNSPANALDLTIRNVEDWNNENAQYDYTVQLTSNDVIIILKNLIIEGDDHPEIQANLKGNIDTIVGLLALACGKKIAPIRKQTTP